MNKTLLFSKKKNYFLPSESNNLKLTSPPKHFTKNSHLLNSNLKPNNNNLNSLNKKMLFFNKKSKRTKKIMKLSEINLSCLNSIKTTILLSNIFPKELQNTSQKWSINQKEILLLKLKIQMLIKFLKIRSFINLKSKMICFVNSLKAKAFNMIEKYWLNYKNKI